MHITGLSKEQDGTIYYKTKNSWGPKKGPNNGFIYMSESYVRSKTLSVLVHKNGVPEAILEKIKTL